MKLNCSVDDAFAIKVKAATETQGSMILRLVNPLDITDVQSYELHYWAVDGDELTSVWYRAWWELPRSLEAGEAIDA